MTIDEIIELGNKAATNCTQYGQMIGTYISGQEYENWLSLSTRFVESLYPNDQDTIRYRKLAMESGRSSETNHKKLMSILNAFKNIPPIPQKQDITDLLSEIFNNFYKFDISIKRRYANRNTIEINDEYDLQDALKSILKLFIDDVRPEDYVPSYAGSNSRVDFFIPKHGIVIETKMTNNSLKDKELGEQLIIDCARYKQNPNYKHLICFIYDKNSYISNPSGLISDLEKNGDEQINVKVYISPQ
jgi:hypothetical protein